MWLHELSHQKDDEGQREQNSHHYAEDTPVALQASQRRAPYEGPIASGVPRGGSAAAGVRRGVWLSVMEGPSQAEAS